MTRSNLRVAFALKDWFPLPIRSAIQNLIDFPLRSALTLLGVLFGVAAIVALANIVNSSKHTMLKDFETLGFRKTTVIFNAADSNDFEALLKSRNDLQRSIHGIEHLALTRYGYGNVYYHGVEEGASIVAATSNYLCMLDPKLKSGRLFTDLDQDQQYAVIGYNVAENYLQNSIAVSVGDHIIMEGTPFRIIGLLDKVESKGSFDPEINDSIVVNASRHKYFGSLLSIGSATILRNEQTNYTSLEFDVLTELETTFPFREFSVSSPESIIESIDRQMNNANLLGNAISIISLITGGVGVMNIMLVAVSERRREIGLRRALGATRGNIRNQFLIESLFLCTLGGVLGVTVGVIVAIAYANQANMLFQLSLASLPMALGVCGAVGIVFGYFPAQNAARVEPINVLYGT